MTTNSGEMDSELVLKMDIKNAVEDDLLLQNGLSKDHLSGS